MKILLVDDDRNARKLLRLIAEKAFHNIIEAENGQEGLSAAAKHIPDLIISDALMPVMDGFSFLREVKTNEALRNIPFIFYSATYTEQEDVKLAMSMGAEAYIIKPKEPDELWTEVGLALRKSKEGKRPAPVLTTPEEEKEHLRRHTHIVALKLEQTVIKLRETLSEQDRAEHEI